MKASSGEDSSRTVSIEFVDSIEFADSIESLGEAFLIEDGTMVMNENGIRTKGYTGNHDE